jgi:hypothetical protein
MTDTENEIKEFIIAYDYFGLSSTALITPVKLRKGKYFNCKLFELKKEIDITYKKESIASFWIDKNLGIPTPLSQFIGQAIESKIDLL